MTFRLAASCLILLVGSTASVCSLSRSALANVVRSSTWIGYDDTQCTDHLTQEMLANIDVSLDWAQTKHYSSANAQLSPPGAGRGRVIFMGDSMSRDWGGLLANLGLGKGALNRSI